MAAGTGIWGIPDKGERHQDADCRKPALSAGGPVFWPVQAKGPSRPGITGTKSKGASGPPFHFGDNPPHAAETDQNGGTITNLDSQ
jgi:hypothetical protein